MSARADAVRIRRAQPQEAEALSALIMRSKAHWGYDPALLATWRPHLRITPEAIASHPAYCAEASETGEVVGVLHFYRVNDEEVYLDDLFVDPSYIGSGVGALLWRHMMEEVRAEGASTVVFEADPNARLFYEHMGAVVVGWHESPEVVGRTMPDMRYELPPR